MQMRAPRLRLAQSGPEKGSRGGEGDSWGGQHAAHTGLPPLPNISHTIPHHGHPSGSHPGQRHRRLPGILLSSEPPPRSLRRTPRWACHPRAMVPPLPSRQGPWQQAAGHLPAQPEEGGSRCCRMPFLWSPELFPASAPGNCRGPPGPLPHQLLVHPAPGASGGEKPPPPARLAVTHWLLRSQRRSCSRARCGWTGGPAHRCGCPDASDKEKERQCPPLVPTGQPWAL